MIQNLEGHQEYVTSACFSPDGNHIISGSADNLVIIWDRLNGKLSKSLKGHSSVVTNVCFTPNGKFIASSSYDKTIKIWDSETG